MIAVTTRTIFTVGKRDIVGYFRAPLFVVKSRGRGLVLNCIFLFILFFLFQKIAAELSVGSPLRGSYF